MDDRGFSVVGGPSPVADLLDVLLPQSERSIDRVGRAGTRFRLPSCALGGHSLRSPPGRLSFQIFCRILPRCQRIVLICGLVYAWRRRRYADPERIAPMAIAGFRFAHRLRRLLAVARARSKLRIRDGSRTCEPDSGGCLRLPISDHCGGGIGLLPHS